MKNRIDVIGAAFSSDSTAYVRIARRLDEELERVNPRRQARQPIVNGLLGLSGVATIVVALRLAARPVLSREMEGFVTVLFWCGLLVTLAAIGSLVATQLHTLVMNRYQTMKESARQCPPPFDDEVDEGRRRRRDSSARSFPVKLRKGA